MHIPDGFLDTKTWVTTAAASGMAISYAVRRANQELEEKDPPLMGVLAAFIFAAQMINFPVAGGTSGHFLGAALAAILIGPWRAMLVMLAVVGVQAFLFGDGGISALGANVFNMAVIAPSVAYLIYGVVKRFSTPVAAFTAGLISTAVTALVVAIELYLSGTAPLAITASLMTGWHIVIGAAEGLITATTVGYLARVRPDLIQGNATLDVRSIAVFSSISVALAVFLSPLASSLPDGLERVAHDLGFIDRATGLFNSLIPDYVVPGLQNEWLATGLAGLVGVGIALGAGFGLASIARRRQVGGETS